MSPYEANAAVTTGTAGSSRQRQSRQVAIVPLFPTTLESGHVKVLSRKKKPKTVCPTATDLVEVEDTHVHLPP